MSLVGDPAVVLILGAASVCRVLRTLNRTQQCFPDAELIVAAPAVQTDKYRQSGWSVLVAGERWLRLDDPRVGHWFGEQSGGVTVVIPLGWPRSALRFVSRFIRDHPQERFLLDWPFGFQKQGISRGTIRGLLWISSWLLWAPRYVIIRFLQFADGLFMVMIQRLAQVVRWREHSVGREIVCHVITTLGTGGAQRQLVQYLRNSRIDRSKLVVLVLWRQPGVVLQEILALGVAVSHLESEEAGFDIQGSLQRGLRMTLAWLRLYGWLFRNRPRSTYSWLFLANILTPSAARLTRVPRIVTSVRNVSAWKAWPEYGRWWFRRVDRLAACLCDVIVVNARAVRDDYVRWSGLNEDRMVVIPNSVEDEQLLSQPYVDIRRTLNIPAGELVVLNVARWVPEKRQSVLIQASSRLAAKGIEFTLILVGHGESEVALRNLADELGVSGKVVFAGQAVDPQSYYRASDVFALSSSLEGMPNVILEAQAFGLPVVATRAGGTGEALVEGETGILVDCDDLEGLTSALGRILLDEDLRRQMGEAGFAHVRRHFDAREMARRVDQMVLPGENQCS